MRFGCAYVLALAALIPLCVLPAHAGGSRAPAGSRPDLRHPPPKDCTRYNGRIGYYANPWCTPAEQRAWDLWDAARHALPPRN
jgi:hypothetical protein